MNKIQRYLLISLFSVSIYAEAGEQWSFNVTPQGLYGNYVDSPIRENVYTEGVLFNLQYLDRFAFLYAYNPLQLYYKNDIPTLHQTTNYFSLRKFLTPDVLSGILTLRLDGYDINNDDPTHETDDVKVVSPIISYINYNQTYYLDFGYAGSWYGESDIGNGSLHLSQYTPTIGIGFNDSTDWIRLRWYDIHSSDSVRSQGVTHSDALEVTLSHYLIYYPFYIPHRIDLSFLVGKRIYAVDSDALVVYNLGDIQKKGIYLQAQWQLSQHIDFLLNGGHLNFTTLINQDRVPYSLNYIYAGITLKL